MSAEKRPARPRQITMAAVMAVVGSAVLVLSLFDTLARLRTPETRQAIDEFLAAPPGDRLALETAQVVELMRMLAYASGALAAMVLVFAVYVLQRHRAARVGLTVTAALLLVTVPVAGLLPLFIAVAALLVWSQPARDWYAGRTPAMAAAGTGGFLSSQSSRPDPPDPWRAPPSSDESPRPHGSHAWRPGPPSASGDPEAPKAEPTVGEPSGEPRPAPPSVWDAHGSAGAPPPMARPEDFAPSTAEGGSPGSAGSPGPSEVQPWGQPAAGYAYPAYSPPPRDPDKRPATVTMAAILTWIGTGAVTAMMTLFAVLLATDGEFFVDEFEAAAGENNVELAGDQVLAAGWTLTAILLFWSLSSAVLAVFAFRRSNGARIALAISAVMVALLSLLTILSVISGVTLLLAGATAVLLFTGGANEWYAGRRRPPGGGYPPGGYPPSGYPQPYQQGPYGQGPYQQGPYQQAPPQGPQQQGPYQQGPPQGPYPGYGQPPGEEKQGPW